MPAAQQMPTVSGDAPTTDNRALYRRFRAQRFGELVGQDPIVTTLRRAVTGDRLAHAYLFVGPRGTGKTSTARILAKAINCTDLGADGEPCDACGACVSIRDGRALDVIEIDAASHGLVEDARDLVMRALTAPSELRKRVYIIDEVHMLSTHAFNALLKLIEEPPDHVVFILATTDTHKVPATIISRTQRYDFRRMADATSSASWAASSRPRGPRPMTTRWPWSRASPTAACATPSRCSTRSSPSLVGPRDGRSTCARPSAWPTTLPSAPHRRLPRRRRAGRTRSRRRPGRCGPRHGPGRRAGGGRGPPPAARIGRRPDGGASACLDPPHPRRGRRRRRARGPRAPPAGAAGRRAGASQRRHAGDRARCSAHSVAPVRRAASPRPTPAAAPPRPARELTAAAAPLQRRLHRWRATAAVPPGGGRRWRAALPAGRRSSSAPARSIKPLLKECRPVARDGARLTLAFPEGRDFMRSRIAQRAPAPSRPPHRHVRRRLRHRMRRDEPRARAVDRRAGGRSPMRTIQMPGPSSRAS